MKKQLMVGLLSAGLVVAMLPGLTAAKDDGKSDCKKGGWTDWVTDDGSPFTDQAECVAYVARGGTLTEPTQPPDPDPTFQSACEESYLGDYRESYQPKEHLLLTPACLWSEIGQTDWETAREVLLGFCTTLFSYPPKWEYAVFEDPIFFGCTNDS